MMAKFPILLSTKLARRVEIEVFQLPCKMTVTVTLYANTFSVDQISTTVLLYQTGMSLRKQMSTRNGDI